MRIGRTLRNVAQAQMRDDLCEILLGHALHWGELLPEGLALDEVLVHGTRAVDGDLEPFLGGFLGRGRGKGQWCCGGLRGGGRGCRWRGGRCAGEERARASHVGHVWCGGCVWKGRGVGLGVVGAGGGFGGGFALESEAQWGGVERFLRAFWGAVDGQGDIVGGIVVFVLEG